MNKDLWFTARRTLFDAQQHFGVPSGSGHRSSINNDGTPYQIALAFDGERQVAKIIVDPSPQATAEEQRELVISRLGSWVSPHTSLTGGFIERIYQLGKATDGTANRYWVASDLERNALEIYSTLAGCSNTERMRELFSLMKTMHIRLPFTIDNFYLGPISLVQNGTFTVYLRPRNIPSVAAILPIGMIEFLQLFSNSIVGWRGILVSLKFNAGQYTGTKVDLCAHCVTPNRYAAIDTAKELGIIYRGTPFTLPSDSKIAFWGASQEGNKQLCYIYAIPQHQVGS